jgi:hypothetical protein
MSPTIIMKRQPKKTILGGNWKSEFSHTLGPNLTYRPIPLYAHRPFIPA